ncbi:MAG: hypothetical protein Q9190_006373 [Brigantiaea leucoxantha]
MFARSLTVLALLAQYTIAQITGTYSSILLTVTGTPTFTVPVEQETNFPKCTVGITSDPALEEAVSKEIASATKSARDAIATRNPTQLADYPPCAIRCVPDAFSASGCKNYDDTFCICRCPVFGSVIGACQIEDCKGDDLAKSLCAPVGGTSPGVPGACRRSSGNGTVCSTGTGYPKPSATAHVLPRSNHLGSFKDSVAKK